MGATAGYEVHDSTPKLTRHAASWIGSRRIGMTFCPCKKTMAIHVLPMTMIWILTWISSQAGEQKQLSLCLRILK